MAGTPRDDAAFPEGLPRAAETTSTTMSGFPGPSDALDDGDLARRIAGAGDSRAGPEEAELCRRYGRRVFLFGLRRLGVEDRAHDLVQDTLVVTLRKLRSGEVREPERIGSFILGVARQLSRASVRDRVRYQSIDSAPSEPSVEVPAPDPLPREQVARCLESLQDRQRAVILLTYYAEQTTAGIASSLGLSRDNVRVIRHRGIARMRACLGLEHEGATA
jgi:RNA polymerase sigma-70 factor (ECF subfamily)